MIRNRIINENSSIRTVKGNAKNRFHILGLRLWSIYRKIFDWAKNDPNDCAEELIGVMSFRFDYDNDRTHIFIHD